MIEALRSSRFKRALDWLLVFCAVAMLIRPLFRAKYLDIWSSIESTFISDARFLRDHWPHPRWQPNWYCGTRTDYVYPPALRYGTAVLAKYVPNLLPVKAYHIYVGFMYCFGIAAVYLFAAWCSKSRLAGFLAAGATALVSPTYLFISTLRHDAPFHIPYRLNVLMRYGEGPHMSALAWIPVALLFTYRAVERWRPVSLAIAAISCAMVVSTNFYGATALAMLFPILIWSLYITHGDVTVWIRAALIAPLAYGLTAFWLVPSYLRITLYNMRFVSAEGNAWSKWVLLAFVIAFVLLSDHFVRGKKQLAYVTFLFGAVAAFFLNCVGNHYLDFRIIGEPSRLFPELDMLMILLGVELLRRWPRVAVGAFAVLVLWPSWNYVSHAWKIFIPEPDYTKRVEYELPTWIGEHMPNARTLPAGTVRFWFNTWKDMQQLGGGSDQGLLNPLIVPPVWQSYLGPEGDMTVRWMQITGVDAVIVNNKQSREPYKDFQFPDKLNGHASVLYDNQLGDVVYGIPRRFPGIARVVDRAGHDALPVIPGNGEMKELDAWYRNVEQGPDAPAVVRWSGTDRFFVTADVAKGQSVWIAESFDRHWQAWSAKTGMLKPRRDALGFMVLDLPPGHHEMQLDFRLPTENKTGYALTALSLVGVIGLVRLGRRG